MKTRFWLSVSAVVAIGSMGCGGSGDTVEYQNAVITQNPDSSFTISDGQKEGQFTTFQLEQGQNTLEQPRSGSAAAVCSCASCGCSGSTCVCTGCTGDCPKATVQN